MLFVRVCVCACTFQWSEAIQGQVIQQFTAECCQRGSSFVLPEEKILHSRSIIALFPAFDKLSNSPFLQQS